MATLASTPRTNRTTVSAATVGPFLLQFRLFDSDALTVYVNGVKTVAWALTSTFLNGFDDNAAITFSTPVSAGAVVQIDGSLIPRRQLDYINGDPNLTKKMNVELARLWSSVAEVNMIASRSLRGFDPSEPILNLKASDLTGISASVTAAAASAAAAEVSAQAALAKQNSMLKSRGPWTVGITYAPSDITYSNLNQYECIIPHVSANFSADLAAGRWRIFLTAGAPGAGTGDVLSGNYGAEYSANSGVFRANVGLAIGREIGALIPGAVHFLLTDIVPEQHLQLLGQTISRTTYAALFAAVGRFCGPGNGTTTFTLPNAQDLFIRGWNGVRALGSIQEDAMQDHIHGLNGNTGGAIQILGSQSARVAGIAAGLWTENFSYRGLGGGRHVSPPSAIDGTVGGIRTANETRPKNIALMAVICIGPNITPPAVLLPPIANGTIVAQFFTQDVPITPINLGNFFTGPPTAITISPATPGLTIGPAPTYTLSGTPTVARGSTAMVVTATRGLGTAIQSFTTLITAPGSTGRASIEGLRYRLTPNGRSSTATLKVPGSDALPAGWSIAGNLVNINAPFSGDIENWDFRGKKLTVYTPIGAVRQNLFGETVASGISFYVEVYVGGRISILEYNDFTGPFGLDGAGGAIKCRNDNGGALVQFGEIPTIRFNHFEGYGSDAIKAVGSYDTAGQIIEWNYFGVPVNQPQITALVYSAAVSYALGAYVIDLPNNRRGMISLTSSNLGNPVPTGTVSNANWRVIDAHGDAITVESAVNKITIRNNLFDWIPDPEGPLGPYNTQGLNNVYRISRNTGSASKIDAIEITNNVSRCGNALTQDGYPIQVSAGVVTNFNGPISFVDNWMDFNGNSAYFHPSTDGWVNTWTNNRNATTDAVITGPTLRGGGVAPVNSVAPVISGATTAGQTASCTTGTWSGTGNTYTYQWFNGGVAISGATAPTVVAPVGILTCSVVATNVSGASSVTSNSLTIAAPASITVDSASLKMPDGNMTATVTGAPAYLADAANWAGSGQAIFASSAGAFAIMVDIPWEQILMSSSQYMGIFGNTSNTGTNTLIMGLQAVRGVNDQDPFNLVFRVRDGIGNNLLATLAVTKAQRRLLCVIRYEAGALQFEVYHEGTRIAVNAPVMGTFVGTQLRSQLLYGAMGSGTVDAFFSNASTFGFIGSIAYFGYNNTGLTQANCQNMSLGVDPLTEVAASGWRMYRRLTDVGTTSLTKIAAATTDATAPLVVYNARSLAWRKGSDIVPARIGANYIHHNTIRDGRVFSRILGQITGRVFLSGIASGVTGLMEARSFDENGAVKQDWTTIIGSTIAAGVFSGYMDAPANNGFGHFDIRPASTPSMVSRIRARTGVGMIIGVMGQSQNARDWQYPVAGASDGSIGALATIDVPSRGATTYGLISTVVSGERIYSGSLIEVANMILSYTTEPVMLMNLSNPGQSTFNLQDDSNTAWNWSEMEALLTQAWGPFAERRGGVLVLDWLTSFANSVNQAGNGIIGNNIQPLLDGTFPAGATTYTVNHYLRDGLTFPASMVYSVTPPSRNTDTALGPVDFSGNTPSPLNHGKGRAQWLTYAASQGMSVGPWTDDLDMGSDGGAGGGGPHQNVLRFEGNPRHLIRKTIAGLWAMGVTTKTNPSLGGAVRGGGGSVFTISANLPNGGTLQTAWGFKVIAVPAGETSVQGFEVQNGGVGAWTRSGFTTSISGGNVVLTKTTGAWAAATNIRYNANGPLDYGTATAALFLFNGALYESGIEEAGLGLPLAGLWTATA